MHSRSPEQTTHPNAYPLTGKEVFLKYHLPNILDSITHNFTGTLRALDPRTNIGKIGFASAAVGGLSALDVALEFSRGKPVISSVLAQEDVLTTVLKDGDDVVEVIDLIPPQVPSEEIENPDLSVAQIPDTTPNIDQVAGVAVTPTPLPTPTIVATPGPDRILAEAQAAYYTQSINVEGVKIMANNAVNPAALQRVREIYLDMTKNRLDIRGRLAAAQIQIAIVPQDALLTSLPEFQRLKDLKGPDGRSYNSFSVRGVGGSLGSPVMAVAEENVLHLPSDGQRAYGMEMTIHEISHSIMDITFNSDQKARWINIYNDLIITGKMRGTYATTNADECWAELTRLYFESATSRTEVQKVDIRLYNFLQDFWGSR